MSTHKDAARGKHYYTHTRAHIPSHTHRPYPVSGREANLAGLHKKRAREAPRDRGWGPLPLQTVRIATHTRARTHTHWVRLLFRLGLFLGRGLVINRAEDFNNIHEITTMATRLLLAAGTAAKRDAGGGMLALERNKLLKLTAARC